MLVLRQNFCFNVHNKQPSVRERRVMKYFETARGRLFVRTSAIINLCRFSKCSNYNRFRITNLDLSICSVEFVRLKRATTNEDRQEGHPSADYVHDNSVTLPHRSKRPNARHHPRPRSTCMRGSVMGRRVHAVVRRRALSNASYFR